MRHILKPLIPALAVAVFLTACGSSKSSSTGSPTAAGTSNAIVTTASNAALGKTILVDSKGIALYSLTAETGGKFICTSSSCVAIWHPLTVSSGAAPTSTVGSIGVVKRPDGTPQLSYNGMPLYTFAHDNAAGEANGQGIKDVGTWTTIAVSGSASGGTGSAAPPEPSPPSGY